MLTLYIMIIDNFPFRMSSIKGGFYREIILALLALQEIISPTILDTWAMRPGVLDMEFSVTSHFILEYTLLRVR